MRLQLIDLVVATSTGEPVQIGTLEVAAGEVRQAPVTGAAEGTALARVLAGLADPQDGRILVGGRDVTSEPPTRRQIGYVPAGGALLPHLTVRANIEYGMRRRELVHDVARRWVDRLVDRLELNSLLDRRPHQLTAAQSLRAAIARAAAVWSEALVVDLPTQVVGVKLVDLVACATPPLSHGIAVLVCSPHEEGQGEAPARAREGAAV